ncbi:MAG TPA: hypothetical protein VM536_00040 [Chloroflexia bacterium]|nr:hypothetical protein [Chloroflexia bacterium]
MNNGKRINPLSRRPRRQRLVVAVRGAAGSGKSVFAASLADAGLGRLCYFDVERKARLLPGSDGTRFDALEVEHPDELPEFIEWALNGEGRQQNYGCYVLDSWAMYFGRKHRETVLAVRERTGDPTAQPSADELAADQMIFQEVLRRLCIDSGACVVVTDQIAAKGREDREENELGQVLPMTSGGLEYFVDVMVEASVRVVDFETERVFRVIKTNSPAFPVGMEFINPTFAEFAARLGNIAAFEEPVAPSGVSDLLEESAPIALVRPSGPTLEDLRGLAQAHDLTDADLSVAARHYCQGKSDLNRLTADEIGDLYRRLAARIEKQAAASAAEPETAAMAGGETRPRQRRA